MSEDLRSHEVFLHIGLHKTATTYLQTAIFPNIKGINFNNKRLEFGKLHDKETKILISNEGMSGCPYLVNGIDYFEQFKKSVGHLMNIFNAPKIIVCFREPGSLVESCYKQYLHEGGTLEWDDFFSIEGGSKIDPDNFFFSKYVNYLSDRVPHNHLFIYDFETFKTKPELVIDEMIKFITGKSFSGVIKNKNSNSAVPLSLEKLLIKLNKAFGSRMTFRIFGKVISQRTILQTLIPRMFKFNKKRDLTEIKNYYESDYTRTKKMISELNPALYKKLEDQGSHERIKV